MSFSSIGTTISGYVKGLGDFLGSKIFQYILIFFIFLVIFIKFMKLADDIVKRMKKKKMKFVRKDNSGF